MAHLTQQQYTALAAAITAKGAWAAYPLNDDGYTDLARALNATASPAFSVWRTNVPIGEVGRAFNGAELAGLTSGNQTRLLTIAAYLSDGVNPSIASNRSFFDDVFSGSGGALTRAALLAIWKRPAKYAEKILATGTGSDGSPGLLTFEGDIAPDEVRIARVG